MNFRQICSFSLATALIALLFASPSVQGANLQTLGIGAYGDSLSWQYSLWVPLATPSGYPLFSDGHQFNWVDHLVMSGYNFGPQIDSTGNGNFYNQNDVAVGGAVSGDLPGQVSQLQPMIAAGNVKLTTLMIGGNDFGVSGEYSYIYGKAASSTYHALNDASVQSFITTLVGNISGAINATLATNPGEHMILATVPDLGVTPAFRSQYPTAARRAEVTTVVNAINQLILALAAQHHFPVVDLNKLGQLSLTPPKIGGVQMLTGGGNSGQRMYLSDGFHPGTVANGLLANAFLKADQLAYGNTVAYISEQTILSRAGLTPSGPPPAPFDLSPYVIFNPVPEPSTMMLAVVASVALLLQCLRTRRVRTF